MGQVLKWCIERSTNGKKTLPRELYNRRDPPKGRGHKICKENIVVLRKIIVIKAKGNIFKNDSPQTLPRKNLCASHLPIYFFSLLSYHP